MTGPWTHEVPELRLSDKPAKHKISTNQSLIVGNPEAKEAGNIRLTVKTCLCQPLSDKGTN